MPDFAFVGESYTARSISQDDQESINLFPEIDSKRGPDKRGVIALYSAPGKTTLLTFDDGLEVRGLYVFSGSQVMIAVCGASVYSISSVFVVTKVGTLITASGPVQMADNGTDVMLVDGGARYVYRPSSGFFANLTQALFTASIALTTMTVTAITNGQLGLFQTLSGSGISAGTQITAFGTGTGGVGTYTVSISQTVGSEAMSALDGAFYFSSQVGEVDTFFVYNNPNTQQWGASNSLSASSQPLSFTSKDGAADNLVAMIVNDREIFLLGERTAEVWVNVGAFPFPFQRLVGTSLQHGCAAQYSVSRLGEHFAWLGQDSRGQGTVYQMKGYTPERISNFAIEYAINRYATISDARAYTYEQDGHEFYVLNFPTADVTWVYDGDTQMWHKRSWRDNLNVLHRDRGNCAATFVNKIIVGDWQNGNLYALDPTVYTDAGGAAMYRLRRAPHLTNDLKNVKYQRFQLQFEPGVGLQGGQGSNPTASLTWSDDGGSTWSNEHWASVGKVGHYKNRTIWRKLGMARDRIFQIVITDPVKVVIVSAELKAESQAF